MPPRPNSRSREYREAENPLWVRRSSSVIGSDLQDLDNDLFHLHGRTLTHPNELLRVFMLGAGPHAIEIPPGQPPIPIGVGGVSPERMNLTPVRVLLPRRDPDGHQATGQEPTETPLAYPTSEYGCGVQMVLRQVEPAKGGQENHLRAGVPLPVQAGDFLGHGRRSDGGGLGFGEGADEPGTLGLEDGLGGASSLSASDARSQAVRQEGAASTVRGRAETKRRRENSDLSMSSPVIRTLEKESMLR